MHRLILFMKARHSIGWLLALLVFLVRAEAEVALPKIPSSSRVLAVEEVKNFWINKLLSTPLPFTSRLYPSEQIAWQRVCDNINQTIRSVRQREYDDKAQIMQLKHNAAAWRLRSNEEKAKLAEEELRKVELHQAQMAALAAQSYAAREMAEAANASRSSCSTSYSSEPSNTIIYVQNNCPQPSSASTSSGTSQPYRHKVSP